MRNHQAMAVFLNVSSRFSQTSSIFLKQRGSEENVSKLVQGIHVQRSHYCRLPNGGVDAFHQNISKGKISSNTEKKTNNVMPSERRSWSSHEKTNKPESRHRSSSLHESVNKPEQLQRPSLLHRPSLLKLLKNTYTAK